ncbi:MAG: xylulokinase, partial [Phycisphaerae bacterium]|nr:xylulokinase [Phycisphaerae bacterium]
EGPAYGAALLASVGAGEYSHIRQAVKAGIKITRTIKPQAASKRLYAKYYARYRELYPALKDQFAAIAEL